MKRRTRAYLALGLVAVLAVTVPGIARPARADAFVDPIVTPVSAFAIDVPSSLLVAATTGVTANGIGSGQLAAMLANASRFDSDWILTPVGQTMGGSTTTTPPDITDLSPAERAQFEELVSTFEGAPATKLAGLTKVVGGKAIPIVGAVLTGAQLGAGLDRAVGVDVDGGLCADAPNLGFQAADAVIAALTSTDCPAWKLSQELQAARNQDTTPTVTATAIGSTSCLDSNCATITSLARIGSSSDYDYCIVWNVPSPNNAVPLGQFSNISQNWYGGWDYKSTALTAADGAYWNIVTVCPAPPAGSYASAISAQINGTAWQYPLTSWKVTQSSAATPAAVTPPTLTYPDPARTIRCDVTLSTGQVLSASTPTFHEGDANIPRPVYPAIPGGSVPTNTQCVETGGPQSLTLSQATTTSPYQSWMTNDKECANGSCLLDLRQNGASCFFSNADCDGWTTDPHRDTTYQCYIGTHAVAISECYIYGSTFNAGARASGHAYADPSNGSSLSTQTSPSRTDELTQRFAGRSEETWGPTETGLELGLDPMADARAVAAACMQLGKADDCDDDLPVFSPGGDVSEAALHDWDAISGSPLDLYAPSGPYPSTLTQGPASASPGWYSNTTPCVTGTYDAALVQCDEYPFISTVQGGSTASIRLVDKHDNVVEGTYLAHFYAVCAASIATHGGNFLVIPIPSNEHTAEYC